MSKVVVMDHPLIEQKIGIIRRKETGLHNDANMLAMGAGIVGENLALEIVETFLNTPFSGEERHSRRISLIEEI